MRLSVLTSLYYLEKPDFFQKSMESIWNDQLVKPDQIVLVKNGPLGNDLEEIIEAWVEILGTKLVIVSIENNIGLAHGLNQGLKSCEGDYIARMDTDDISTKARFKNQITFLDKSPSIDIVGTYIAEIDDHAELIKKEVKYPINHNDLLKFFSKRDPVAHPTVMFRRSFFQKAGFYNEETLLFEDTSLWYYGFLSGCIFANLPFIGVKYRRGSSFYKRRSEFKKSIQLFKYRILVINRGLNFSIASDIYAFGYLLLSLSPPIIKKMFYQSFR